MSKRKKKNIIKRNLPILIIIALIAGGGGYYISHIEQKEIEENQIYQTNEAYHSLENQDSTKYVARILINNEVSILTISEKFYKSKIFWPYIFQENEIDGNILNISTGTILNIPIIASELLDTTKSEIVAKLKVVGDSLLSEVSEERQKALETKSMSDW